MWYYNIPNEARGHLKPFHGFLYILQWALSVCISEGEKMQPLVVFLCQKVSIEESFLVRGGSLVHIPLSVREAYLATTCAGLVPVANSLCDLAT